MESFPGANVLLLGSGIDIMQGAMEKAKLEGVSTPPFVEALDMKTLKNLIKTAKTVHDQKLGTVKRYGVYNCITVNLILFISSTSIFIQIVGDHALNCTGSTSFKSQFINLCFGL